MPSKPYKSTPVFDEASLPQALRRAHSTKPGVWALIQILEGAVRYHVEDGTAPPLHLAPGRPGLVRPGQLHHVEPLGPMRMRVDFYDHAPTPPSGGTATAAAQTGAPEIEAAAPAIGTGPRGSSMA